VELKGETFLLRKMKIEDKIGFAKHANNPKVFENLRDRFPHPYSESDAENFIEFVLSSSDPQTNFTIEFDGEAIGNISIFLKEDVYRKNAEIGYWIGESYWGRGIMTKAVKLIVEYIFSTFDVLRVYATPFSTSLGSMKVLEKAGFKKEAVLSKSVFKNGQFLDEHIYSILKEQLELDQ